MDKVWLLTADCGDGVMPVRVYESDEEAHRIAAIYNGHLARRPVVDILAKKGPTSWKVAYPLQLKWAGEVPADVGIGILAFYVEELEFVEAR